MKPVSFTNADRSLAIFDVQYEPEYGMVHMKIAGVTFDGGFTTIHFACPLQDFERKIAELTETFNNVIKEGRREQRRG